MIWECIRDAYEICLNLFYLLKSVKSLLLTPVDLKSLWVASRSVQADRVLVHPKGHTFLSIHSDFFTSVMDIAWADLMLYEWEGFYSDGIHGKIQKVHIGSK